MHTLIPPAMTRPGAALPGCLDSSSAARPAHVRACSASCSEFISNLDFRREIGRVEKNGKAFSYFSQYDYEKGLSKWVNTTDLRWIDVRESRLKRTHSPCMMDHQSEDATRKAKIASAIVGKRSHLPCYATRLLVTGKYVPDNGDIAVIDPTMICRFTAASIYWCCRRCRRRWL